jgi:hypothetical protein
MYALIFIPFIFQALVIAIDEGYFHIRRGLPRWERIGHPLDTLSVFICLLYVLIVHFSPTALLFYLILAIFSCIFVTKDEFIHKQLSPAAEQWLHALLFINHPIVFASTGLIWFAADHPQDASWVTAWLDHPEQIHTFLAVQTAMIGAFFAYQVIYWNVLWKEKTKA